jgi:hypothetical protein
MLIATLCLQTSLTDAECRPERRGPYLLHSDCQDKVAPMRDELLRLASDLGAKVLFASARCEKGNDI